MKTIYINKKAINQNSKVYFIADIAANHDGSLNRAKKLIRLCAKAGANAAKFQHFKAKTIVFNEGFKKIGKLSHQTKWKKSIYQVYKDASIDLKWSIELQRECKKNNIDFLTAPYDLDYVDKVNKYIPAYKIGSGDITWKEIIIKIAKKKKPSKNKNNKSQKIISLKMSHLYVFPRQGTKKQWLRKDDSDDAAWAVVVAWGP